MKPTPLPLKVSLSALATLLLAACETRPDRHAMMEEARHSVPPMVADEKFFDGAILAHLTLGGDTGANGEPGSDSENGGGQQGSGSGGGRHGGGRGGMGGGSRGSRQGGDSSGGDDSDAAAAAIRHSASNMPPAMLRLHLENTTSATLVVEVRELNSELGNFAVRPDKLTLDPGQSAEPDPMQSLLGVDTYTLPVTITLRIAGTTESKILTLHLLKPAPDAPPPAS